jgi:hypothetical protein
MVDAWISGGTLYSAARDLDDDIGGVHPMHTDVVVEGVLRTPKPAGRDTRERSMWRALESLCTKGKLVKVGDRITSSGGQK